MTTCVSAVFMVLMVMINQSGVSTAGSFITLLASVDLKQLQAHEYLWYFYILRFCFAMCRNLLEQSSPQTEGPLRLFLSILN